ncbi:MAG: protease pro-enzyme activation domain-containing protein, partial [Flammeovirgaceae bacterium]
MRHTSESLKSLEKTFWEVADPKSSEFRKFKSIAELSSLVSVPESTVLLTKNWLQSIEGVKMESVEISSMGDSLTVDYEDCQNLQIDNLKAPKIPTNLKENVIDYVIIVTKGN